MYRFHPYLDSVQVVCEVFTYTPAEEGHYTGLPENCEPDIPAVFDYEIKPANEEDADHEIFSRPLTWAEENSLLEQFEAYCREF